MNANALENRLKQELTREWGYVMGSEGLRLAFGFATQAALRAAIVDGRLPVRTFTLERRKGQFALTCEVAAWLASHDRPKTPPSVTSWSEV